MRFFARPLAWVSGRFGFLVWMMVAAGAPWHRASAQQPILAAGEPTKALSHDNEDCLACHEDEDLEAETERGKTLDLVVMADAFLGTPHEDLACVECHTGEVDFDEVPHNGGQRLSLGCGDCHEEVAAEYDQSAHGRVFNRGDEEAAGCADCHGKHRILSSADRRASTNKFRLQNTCAACHKGGALLDHHDIGEPEAVEQYIDSIHGRALLVDGLAVTATCNDCHGVHDILPRENPRSRISKKRVPDTCGQCHVLVEEVYAESVHGQLLAAGHRSGPTCIDCHSSHEIVQPSRPEFRLAIDDKCGGCHEDRLLRYRETFHGKAILLGRPGVAACHDCHGHHDIQPSYDVRSWTGEQKRLRVCQRCHPDANPGFAAYLVHADHTNRQDSPQLYWTYWGMTALLLGTFAFFGIHSLLWATRSLALYLRDPRAFREQKVRARADDDQFIRFRPIDRFLHSLVVFSFILLVVTGMPLKFYYEGWARWLLDLMGGQAVAAVLHRIGAIITIFYFVVHLLHMSFTLWQRRWVFRDVHRGRVTLGQILAVVFGPDSPVPNRQDFRDFWAHQKWFFGKAEKPQFDRWTYWEKFDYFAVFWGVVVIGLSGLVMWFPTVFTSVLPGWVINVALVVHSDEALLAAGFIFTFHFFNVHFRIEKFPMDPVIFSGRISRTELAHERRRQLERWEASGELEQHRIKDEWASWRWIALPAGFLAFLVGTALVVMIYAAMVTRLVE